MGLLGATSAVFYPLPVSRAENVGAVSASSDLGTVLCTPSLVHTIPAKPSPGGHCDGTTPLKVAPSTQALSGICDSPVIPLLPHPSGGRTGEGRDRRRMTSWAVTRAALGRGLVPP